MHSFIFYYDTRFSTGLLCIKVKAETKEAAKADFFKLVPGCTEIRKIVKEY